MPVNQTITGGGKIGSNILAIISNENLVRVEIIDTDNSDFPDNQHIMVYVPELNTDITFTRLDENDELSPGITNYGWESPEDVLYQTEWCAIYISFMSSTRPQKVTLTPNKGDYTDWKKSYELYPGEDLIEPAGIIFNHPLG